MNPLKIATVIVSYNREELLEQCLKAHENQTRLSDYVIVVDNNSTDNSLEVAKASSIVNQVVSLKENTGGAGGFAAGIAKAICDFSPNYVWIMDDDSVPEENALEELLVALEKYDGSPAVLASEAVWHDGTVHPMNKSRPRPFLNRNSVRKAQSIGCIPIRTASFVSILIDSRAILEEGLPIADYFIWNDDFEYTGRILANRVGLYVPASRVKHLTKELAGSDKDPGQRFYYEVRNKMWTFIHSKAFVGFERIVYVLATCRRWIRTYKNSDNKNVLKECFLRGLKDGLHFYTPTRKVFENTEVAEQVGLVELPLGR